MRRILLAMLAVLAFGAVALPAERAEAQDMLVQPRMMIYAGPLHREYLGCLNCYPYNERSVWNNFSPFGWGNDYPLMSHFQDYRAPHGRYSACDPHAADPPILLDINHTNYGRLSVSITRPDSICGQRGDKSICQALTAMCNDVAWPQQQ
jgi:hypothetical protein